MNHLPDAHLAAFAEEVTFLEAPKTGSLEELVEIVLERAARGEELVLQTPARTERLFAQRLFEMHDGLCFEAAPAGGSEPTLFTYFGPRVWAFKQLFAPRGAVFLRGRGHAGPWRAGR